MSYRSKLMGFTAPAYIGLYLVFFIVSIVYSQNFKCPQFLSNSLNVCERLTCGSPVSQHDCPTHTLYMDNFALCGCCPSCVQFLHLENEEECVTDDSPSVKWTSDPADCDDEFGFCPVKVNTCLPGLVCNAGKCELPSRSSDPPDSLTKECMFRKSLRRLDPQLVHWDPDCEPDGSFSPKQCKGTHSDGECFCVSREGNRIFGREWRINSENQTCECSRKADELRNRQGLTATFHCTPDGNFEPLQCDTDTGLCYCVNPQTGELDGAVLPESQWKSLPCFSLNLTDGNTDGKYLRQCESKFAGIRQLQLIGKEHNMEIQMEILNCDFDGSYSPVQLIHTQSQCTFKNGTKIKDYSMLRNDAMTCNCARDQDEYLPSEDRFFSYDCQQRTGNYDIVYDFGSHASCVDKDGFLYGDVVPSENMCCLIITENAEGGLKPDCTDNMAKFCYDADLNENGYKPCPYWWYMS